MLRRLVRDRLTVLRIGHGVLARDVVIVCLARLGRLDIVLAIDHRLPMLRIGIGLARLGLLDVVLAIDHRLSALRLLVRPDGGLVRGDRLLAGGVLLLADADIVAIVIAIMRQIGRTGDGTRTDRHGVSVAAIALGLPSLMLLLDMRVMPRLPLGIAGAGSLPFLALGEDRIAPLLPLGRISRLALVMLRRLVEGARPVEIARRRLGPLAGEYIA